MKKTIITALLLVLTLGTTVLTMAFKSDDENKSSADVFEAPAYRGMEEYSAESVANVIDKVWTYYTSNYFTQDTDWLNATFHLGAIEAYKATGNLDYYNHTYAFAEANDWMCNYGVNTTYLDDIAASQVYCSLDNISPAVYKIEGVKKAFDYTYRFGMLDYSWVDEIYMVGYAQTYLSKRTGDSKYSEIDFDSYMFYRKEFFDPVDMLWYRDGRYVSSTDNPAAVSTNGKKVYWGRGNAWVYVSLAQRMEYMDKAEPAYETYKNDFLMMSKALLKVQRDDGVWNANLGDANDHSGKEMTGTGGFVYGIALGVRLGILNYREYVPVLQKAYDTIVKNCIYDNGLVGYCQPVGSYPAGYTGEEALKTNTNSFGVGLQLMGLSQFMRLCSDYNAPELTVPSDTYDKSKAIYAIDEGWYKGPMTVYTDATNIENGNGADNLVNGVWARDNTGSRFSAFGLRTRNISATIEIHEQLSVNKIIVYPYNYRAYAYTLELFDGKTWRTVVDTRNSSLKASLLNKWDVGHLQTTKLRFTCYGCLNEDTDACSIKEILIYND